MAFGNPYGDAWSVEEVLAAMENIADEDVKSISLADTVGLASPGQVADLVGATVKDFAKFDIGAHLHSRPEGATEKILAAYDAGCRRFDSAIGGLGGCPFAQDALVGNMPTEKVIEALAQRGVESPIKKSLSKVMQMSSDIAGEHAPTT